MKTLQAMDFPNLPNESARIEAVIERAESLDLQAVEAMRPTLNTFPSRDAARLLSSVHYEVIRKQRKAALGFTDALWPHLERCLPIEEESGGTVAALMCALDPKRAVQVLCTEDSFKIENPRLPAHLRALKVANVLVPADRLIRLLEGPMAESALTGPILSCLEPALVLLARQKHARAKEWIDQILAAGIPKPPPYPGNDAPPEVRFRSSPASARFTAAAEALLRYHGLEISSFEIGLVIDASKGEEGLPKAQWTAFVVAEYLHDVESGGHAQFYSENADKQLVDLLPAALEAVGARDFLDLFLESNAVWGDKNPIKNARQLTWEDLQPTPEQERQLSDLDKRFYHLDCNQRLASIIALYAVKHVEDFRDLQ